MSDPTVSDIDLKMKWREFELALNSLALDYSNSHRLSHFGLFWSILVRFGRMRPKFYDLK